LNGTHVLTKLGVTDVTTDDCHAEIKRWDEHKQALGQLLSYNRAMPRDKLQMYFFDLYSDAAKKRAVENLQSFDIEVFEFIHEDEKVHIINFLTRETVFTYAH
jgi:hypothetical protein